MKRVSIISLIVVFSFCSLGMFGCAGDDREPSYWIEKLPHRREREHALKKISAMFNKLKLDNNNNVAAAPVKEFGSKVTPGLVDVYKGLRRDRVNRLEIIKLLASMENPAANPAFLEGLDADIIKETQIFTTSAAALSRVNAVEAVPKLLATHVRLSNERTARESPFTNRENEIEEAVVTALISFVVKNPNLPDRAKIVEVLCQVADTRDSKQDLRLNMHAIKGLGQIGDPASIPTLVRGIAMQGEVQKVGLGPFAFVGLQNVTDRDAVVDAIILLGRGKDAAFNDYFKEELESDAMMKVPVWALQQAIDFLGLLNYSSPKAIEFLMAEVNHTEPDDVDKVSAAKGEGEQKFTDVQWASWRRNWATVTLAQLGHKPILDVVRERFKFKKAPGGKTELDVTAEEAVGLLRALGFLQYPAQSCPILLEAAKTGSEALRDKIFYYSATMGCADVLPMMKEEHDKIDCKKIIAERFPEDADEEEKKKGLADCKTLKGRIQTYMNWMALSKRCAKDLECYLKEIKDRSPDMEAAIFGAFRQARGNEEKSKLAVEAIASQLDNPLMPILEANLFALDRLTPNGDKALIERAKAVRLGFASQQAYKDRARLVEGFTGRLKVRTK